MSTQIHIKKITAINCYELSPSFDSRKHTHDAWELFYSDSGTMNVCYEGSEPFTLKAGEILLHKPMIPHVTVCDGKHSAVFFNVIFKSASPALEMLSGRPIAVPEKLTPLISEIIKEARSNYVFSVQPIKKASDAPIGGEQMFKSYLEMFLIHILRCCKVKNENRRQGSGNNVPEDDVYRFLSENICSGLTLDDICEHFHFGKTHISVSFKKKFGLSIIDCYLNLKINEAKRLLREEGLTIREISERLCFDSPEYFSRCFKKRTGHTPKSYKTLLIDGKIEKK